MNDTEYPFELCEPYYIEDEGVLFAVFDGELYVIA